MTDTWVPSPPQPPGPPPPDNLPPANAWAPTTPCASADSPSIVPSIIITGVPAIIASAAGGQYVWSITLNDGGTPANFSIDRYDATGALIEHPIAISGTNGDVTLTHDPTQPLGAATKQYIDAAPPGEAPMDYQTYARDMGAWVALPPIIPDAPNTSQRFGRFNSIWQLDAIQTDAPNDGNAYARQSGAWTAAITGGPYLPLTGGTITGSLTVNQVLTVQGANSMALSAPGGNQRAILGQTSGLTRWQLQLGDITAEGLSNAGSNFALTAYSNTAGFLGNWLTIARADGSTAFAGPVNMNAGAAVNGTLALQGPGSFILPGGTAGQALTTDGAGGLSWSAPPGGVTDAPNDGTAYARKSVAWAHLTHTDITDWAATLAPYALLTNVPPASTTPPIMDGTATPGSAANFSRGDHVHPSDTSRYAASNPSGYQTAAQVTAALPPASTTTPLADGIAAIGTSGAFARADHVHPLPPQAMGENRIINGNFAVNQRSQVSGTALAAAAYGHDRWKAGASGCTYTFTAALPDTTITITAGSLTQIIEAGLIEGGVYTLSWTGTAQARVYQGAPAGSYAASPITTAALPAGVNTIVELNAGTVARVKLEIGSVATPFNRQSMAKSQADCERYFRWLPFNMYWNSTIAGTVNQAAIAFPTMRASPTFGAVVADPNTAQSSSNNSAQGFGSTTPYSTAIYVTATAPGATSLLGYRASASAEL